MQMPGLNLGQVKEAPPNRDKNTEVENYQKQIQPPKKMGLGLGLDIAKAQNYQQEFLMKNEQII